MPGATSFAPDPTHLYHQYGLLTMSYPGWTLSEIKAMSLREREYWSALYDWKQERIRNAANTPTL